MVFKQGDNSHDIIRKHLSDGNLIVLVYFRRKMSKMRKTYVLLQYSFRPYLYTGIVVAANVLLTNFKLCKSRLLSISIHEYLLFVCCRC